MHVFMVATEEIICGSEVILMVIRNGKKFVAIRVFITESCDLLGGALNDNSAQGKSLRSFGNICFCM